MIQLINRLRVPWGVLMAAVVIWSLGVLCLPLLLIIAD